MRKGTRHTTKTDPRLAALSILKGVRVGKVLVDELLQEHLSEIKDPRDRALAHELAFGVLRQRSLLDWYLLQNIEGQSLRVPAVVQDILRLGAYQILFCERIPTYAAVSQTVGLCRETGFSGLCGLVNGILRSLDRRTRAGVSSTTVEEDSDPETPAQSLSDLPLPKEDEKPLTIQGAEGIFPEQTEGFVKHVSVRYSLPEWIIEKLLEVWSPEDVVGFATASLEVPPLTIRVHPRILSPSLFAEQCRDSGIEAEPVSWLPDAFFVRSRIPVSQLPGIEQGGLQVQDLGAQLTTLLLDPLPGERILEVGSAPGGKTTHISERIRPTGRLFAVDNSAHRCEVLQKNLDRIGARNVQLIIADGTKPLPLEPDSMDRALVDAPCSGLGTLRRRVDLKWRLQPRDIVALSETQRALLASTAEYVKPDGVLVYSTCTILREENEAIVEEFIADHPNWKVESARAFLPDPMKSAVLPSGGLQTLPHRHGMDGNFGIRLRRTPKSTK
ncbi:MAG TPA: transcription antitermination factor NusB [bacterium]|nr:transcription antitermination factor NusB [bacterium]